ncbi:hypothetical protein OF001_U470005 [Pseudomonas sp. OF001]|nr:hypothetical protein OF001_U470005 [Pseudomonas sp. OF001]
MLKRIGTCHDPVNIEPSFGEPLLQVCPDFWFVFSYQ